MKEELLDDGNAALTNNEENASHECAQLKYRIVASLIDFAIIMFLSFLLKQLVPDNIKYLYLIVVCYLSAIYLYFIIQECDKHSATFGKRLTRLIITNMHFDKISIIQSFIRTSIKLMFIYCYLLQFILIVFLLTNKGIHFFLDFLRNPNTLLLKIYALCIPLFLSIIIPVLLLISILRDEKYRGWHDKIARTIVLRHLDSESNTENVS